MGWRPPRPPGYLNYHLKEDVPFSAQNGVHLAPLTVGAQRDVYGVDRVDQIEEKRLQRRRLTT